MPGGRPTKLTPQLQAQLVEALKRTYYLETAADLVGIERHSVYHWIKKGRREPGSPEAAFSAAIKKAMAEREADNLSMLENHGAFSWQALAWLCERSSSKRWGNNAKELRDIKKELKELKDIIGAQYRTPTPQAGPPPAGNGHYSRN